MKVDLILYPESEADEEMLKLWRKVHLQTYVQDFLEIDAEQYGKEINVSLPNITYQPLKKSGDVQRT